MSGRRLVVIGDALLDRDLEGRVNRLSPDAPVPVVEDPVESVRPGGAGPVSAHVFMPSSSAAPTAASTFPLSPEVLSAINTSPGRPWALTCRAKHSCDP